MRNGYTLLLNNGITIHKYESTEWRNFFNCLQRFAGTIIIELDTKK